jgi:hypothetical protein
MKILFLIPLLIIACSAAAQTKEHKAIAGTKCSMIPPKGFTAATAFSGFENEESGASIMVTEIPESADKIGESFTAEALKKQGMQLISKEIIDFNNAKALLIKASQPANGTTYLKQVLVFGDGKKTILVNGIYPVESKKLEGDIKKALLSAVYNEAQDDNPLDAVKFTIDISGSGFELAKYIAGSLIYTADGKIPTDKPMLIAANSIGQGATGNQEQFCKDRLKQMPRGEQNTIKEINPVRINDLTGYEITAAGKDKNGKDELVYQVILFEDNGDYYMVAGKAAENADANLQLFKTIARTFKRK